MPKIYYKVLQAEDKKLYSANFKPKSNIDNGLCLEYVPNQWTYPKIKNSRLYLFKTLEDAKRFYNTVFRLSYNNKAYIYTCHATNIGKPTMIGGSWEDAALDFWKYKNSRRKIPGVIIKYRIPKGTLSAHSIKILEKVYG